MNIHRRLLVVVWAILTMTTASAADYPARPVRFIVPYGAGSGPDVTARLFLAELGKQLEQQIVIDNRAGAGGSIGTEMIVRAPPDGYTIGFGGISVFAINPNVLAKLPYDTDKDLVKIVQTYFNPGLLAVTLSLPIHSMQDLIDYAKKNPGKLAYGSSGNGTSSHLSGELLGLMTGTQLVHVPYKLVDQGVADTIGGRLPLMFNNMGPMLPQVKAGRIRGLGVTSLKRSPAIPELPAIAETVPDFEVIVWGGVVAPAGVPKPVVARLNAAINKVLALPALKEKYAAIGYELVGGTPQQFDAFVKKEIAKWADVIKRSGAKFD
jgi:tripartite-type tricarboxylate transporter receptor subunit TctC